MMIINSRSINKRHGKTADFHSLTLLLFAPLHSFHFWLNNGHFSFHHTGENVVQTLSLSLSLPLKITCWRGGERNNKGRSENGFSTVVVAALSCEEEVPADNGTDRQKTFVCPPPSLPLFYDHHHYHSFIHLFLSFREREFFRRLQQQRRRLLLPLFLYNRLENTPSSSSILRMQTSCESNTSCCCWSSFTTTRYLCATFWYLWNYHQLCWGDYHLEESCSWRQSSRRLRRQQGPVICVWAVHAFLWPPRFFSLLVVFACLIWFSSSLKLWRPRPFVSPW